jgi:hypothetical protein
LLRHGALIRKACELGEKTGHFRTEVIFKATLWMEEKYREAPEAKIAVMIALHYMILAMRQESRTQPHTVEDYITQALAWWKTASRDHCWQPTLSPDKTSKRE